MAGGHDLGDDGMDIVVVGIHAKPHDEDDHGAEERGEGSEHLLERPLATSWMAHVE